MRRERWEETTGLLPHKVWVGERADKDNVLYLRWRVGSNWRWKSLRTKLYDDRGKIIPEARENARKAAEAQHRALSGGAADNAALTLDRTWAKLTDPETGKYPIETPHRKEVGRALRKASRILGGDTAWVAIDKAALQKLGRAVADELIAAKHDGFRGAEIVVQRILAIAAWLRDDDHIPADSGHARSKWRAELRDYVAKKHGGTMPEPKRPRHTLPEMRRILERAWEVDPRFGLLMALGAELRLGQVARARRSNLDLDHWALRVRGRGKKRGATVLLTPGQRAAVRRALKGYLAKCEASFPEVVDYPLFPSGQLKEGRSEKPWADPMTHGNADCITGTTWRDWFREAEKLARVRHQKGRGAYGLRRVAVDAANESGISRQGLQEHGGWSDTQMPDRIYADQQAEYAQKEARQVRAKIRGERKQRKEPKAE